MFTLFYTNNSQTLLSTAEILVVDNVGRQHKVSALLDSRFQSNFMTEDLCKKLRIVKNPYKGTISGINQTVSHIKYSSLLEFFSNHNTYRSSLSCLVLPRITDSLPQTSFDKTKLKLPEDIKLADNYFNKSSHIDVLIGSQKFWDLIVYGKRSILENNISLQKTK